MSGFAAGPVLYIGAVTRVMDGACYSQVICIIAIVATKLPRSPSWSAFFFYFFTVTDHTLSEPIQKLFLLSFLFSLSGMVGEKKKRLVPDATDPRFFPGPLCAPIDPPPHSDPLFLPNVPRLYVSFSPPSPLYLTLSLSLSHPNTMVSCCRAPSGCVWDSVVGWHLAASDKRVSELLLFLLRCFKKKCFVVIQGGFFLWLKDTVEKNCYTKDHKVNTVNLCGHK